MTDNRHRPHTGTGTGTGAGPGKVTEGDRPQRNPNETATAPSTTM